MGGLLGIHRAVGQKPRPLLVVEPFFDGAASTVVLGLQAKGAGRNAATAQGLGCRVVRCESLETAVDLAISEFTLTGELAVRMKPTKGPLEDTAFVSTIERWSAVSAEKSVHPARVA